MKKYIPLIVSGFAVILTIAIHPIISDLIELRRNAELPLFGYSDFAMWTALVLELIFFTIGTVSTNRSSRAIPVFLMIMGCLVALAQTCYLLYLTISLKNGT